MNPNSYRAKRWKRFGLLPKIQKWTEMTSALLQLTSSPPIKTWLVNWNFSVEGWGAWEVRLHLNLAFQALTKTGTPKVSRNKDYYHSCHTEQESLTTDSLSKRSLADKPLALSAWVTYETSIRLHIPLEVIPMLARRHLHETYGHTLPVGAAQLMRVPCHGYCNCASSFKWCAYKPTGVHYLIYMHRLPNPT